MPDSRALAIPDCLVCPATKIRLHPCSLAEAERMVSNGRPLTTHQAGDRTPVGPTPRVMLREDGACAYPLVDDIPVLLAPEVLVSDKDAGAVDLSDPRYTEAYGEMAYYNAIADNEARVIVDSETFKALSPILRAHNIKRSRFPEPLHVWLDAVYDCASQEDAYRHIAPLEGKRVLQLGGKGLHAVVFLLAGAQEAWLLTPMLSEAKFALTLARQCNVEDRLRCVVGIAEELPFANNTFSAMYCSASVHHMVTGLAMPEAARVLRDEGKFSAIEPWRAPLYALGVRVFGQREPDVLCTPLTQHRMRPLFDSFKSAKIIHHGALTRYFLITLDQLGIHSSLSTVLRITRIDDALCSAMSPLRSLGSGVALLGVK